MSCSASLRPLRGGGLLLSLLFLSLFFRALIPQGYMPVADASGARLVLCSIGSLADGLPGVHVPSVQETCPFGHALNPAALPGPEMPALWPTGQGHIQPASALSRAAAASCTRPRARAPPVHA